MDIRELNGKSICLLGFGKEGQATLRALERFAPSASVTIADANEKLTIDNCQLSIQTQTGASYLNNLQKFDIVIKSPGIPPNQELRELGSKVTSSTQIFLDSIAKSGATVIGVTGSKGKSTTSSLIVAILKAAGKDVHLIGNIGIPAIDFIDAAKPGTIFVQELSSYQLADLTTSPHIAVVTSFFPEHLDYHGSLDAYREAKTHIAKFQSKDDLIAYATTPPETADIANVSPGKKLPYNEKDAPLALKETKLKGMHNLRNIAGAWVVSKALGVDPATAVAAIRAFEGLPHRLQALGTHHQIEWVDDAISTTPESTIEGIRALEGKVRTLICGGQDRGYDFAALGREIVASGITTLILLPHTGEAIHDAVDDAGGKTLKIITVTTMQDAVDAAKKQTEQGTICLLSCASPSYNLFKNFEERGEMFAEAVRR